MMVPPQVNANQPFTVTLEAQQWNLVLAALHEVAYRISAPLIQTISDQLQGQAISNGQDNIAVQPPH
jgi:hypothetical protein